MVLLLRANRCLSHLSRHRFASIVGSSFSSLSSSSSSSLLLQGYSLNDPECNVTSSIASKVGTQLHKQPLHPLGIIRHTIQEYWGPSFQAVDDLSPIVSVQDNFDKLLIPSDHVSRSKSDTYYLNETTVLRCHTSAHQSQLLQQGLERFLVTGDVYRRDEIDSSHYPVFHQMEGVKVFTPSELEGLNQDEQMDMVVKDLKGGLEGMAKKLFGDVEMKWVDTYFPFTEPSFELEIYYQNDWLEVLGCGVMQPQILKDAGRGTPLAWAFGLGLERLAMVLFDIPDIRLFWSQDERFHKQFRNGTIGPKFQPFSKYPACFKDISFWQPQDFHPNDLMELVRTVAGDLVERVELIDQFCHPKTLRISNCFRISYRSMDRSLTNEEIDALQDEVRKLAVDKLHAELR